MAWRLLLAGAATAGGLLHPLAAAIPDTWSSRGAGGGGALYSPSINPANNNEYFVACDMSGLYHTTDFGNSYSTVNFTQIQAGHDAAVRFTSNPNLAYGLSYAGDQAQPVKSTDGGQTWTVLPGNPLPYDDAYSVWADYNQPNHVVVAGYSQIFFSADGGASFKALSIPIDSGTGALIGGAFFDGNAIYLGTSVGLLVSTNGGTSFTNAGTPGIPAGEFIFSFAAAKTGSTTRFFCLTGASVYPGLDAGSDYYGFFRGIYSLDNATGNWTKQMTGIDPANDFPMFLAMATNDITTVYAAGGSSAGNPEVFKSTNAGASWTNTFRATNNQNIITGWSGQGGDRAWSYGEIVLGLGVAPNDSRRVLFTDLGFVHRTSDGGATWQQAYVSPADQHPAGATNIAKASYHGIGLENTSCWQMVWSDAQNVFAAFTDIKGLRSTDAGATWSFNYTGHNGNTMYRLARHPTTGVLYAGTSDIHDLYQSTRLANSPLDGSDANGKVLFSADKGATWQTLHSFGHPVFWVSLDPTAPNRLYASVVHSTAGGVFVCNDIQNGAASTWTKLPNPPRTEGHPATIVVLNDGKVVCTYSGHRNPGFTASSGVFVYDPATLGWTDVSDPGMRYWTKDIVVDPSDATQNTWYVGVFSGWGGPPNGLGGLYRTTDRGGHWSKINTLDRVTSITFNPSDATEAFLTTETEGLWHTTNLPAAVPVFALVSNYPFRQPERVFYNPTNAAEIWVTSFGNGLRVGSVSASPVGPAITTQPAPLTVTAGQNASFTVAASGTAPLSYQWRKGGVNLSGATNATYTIASAQVADAGVYSAVVSNSVGSATSNNATLTVNSAPPPAAPAITTQPAPLAVTAGQNASFTVAASGTAPLSYQWRKGGANIAGATNATYAIASAQVADAGVYSAVVSNSAGSATSNNATLTVTAAPVAPSIAAQPSSVTVAVGQSASFAVAANGTGPLAYQWSKNSVNLGGATSATLTLASVTAADAGTYQVLVSGPGGTVQSAAATLTIGTTTSRLVNISTRSWVGTGGDQLIAGFIIGGATPKQVLLRASGPALAAYGVTGLLVDPMLTLVAQATGAALASNDNWCDDAAGIATLETAFARTGAFPWTRGSRDAALLVTLNPGAYTALVSGAGGTTGVALIEAYECDTTTGNHLVNISTRSQVQTGAGVQIAGFYVQGGSMRLLIRAAGPSLARFGLEGTLAAPTIDLVSQATGQTLATVAGWDPALAAVFARIGEFPFATGSTDAALEVTLPAGGYTAVVKGQNGGTGVALIEVDEDN